VGRKLFPRLPTTEFSGLFRPRPGASCFGSEIGLGTTRGGPSPRSRPRPGPAVNFLPLCRWEKVPAQRDAGGEAQGIDGGEGGGGGWCRTGLGLAPGRIEKLKLPSMGPLGWRKSHHEGPAGKPVFTPWVLGQCRNVNRPGPGPQALPVRISSPKQIMGGNGVPNFGSQGPLDGKGTQWSISTGGVCSGGGRFLEYHRWRLYIRPSGSDRLSGIGLRVTTPAAEKNAIPPHQEPLDIEGQLGGLFSRPSPWQFIKVRGRRMRPGDLGFQVFPFPYLPHRQKCWFSGPKACCPSAPCLSNIGFPKPMVGWRGITNSWPIGPKTTQNPHAPETKRSARNGKKKTGGLAGGRVRKEVHKNGPKKRPHAKQSGLLFRGGFLHRAGYSPPSPLGPNPPKPPASGLPPPHAPAEVPSCLGIPFSQGPQPGTKKVTNGFNPNEAGVLCVFQLHGIEAESPPPPWLPRPPKRRPTDNENVPLVRGPSQAPENAQCRWELNSN